MSNSWLAPLSLLGILVSLHMPMASQAQTGRATVLSIGDGDTIRVRQAGKALTVRLACIDAPENAVSDTHLTLPTNREV